MTIGVLIALSRVLFVKEARQPGGQPGDIGDEEHRKNGGQEHRHHGFHDQDHRFAETIGGKEKVHPDRRSQETGFEVCQENNPQVNRVDPEGQSQRRNERHDHHDGRIDIHQAADGKERQVQAKQENPGRADMGRDPFHGQSRNFRKDQVIGEAQCQTEDQQYAADQESAFAHGLGQIFLFGLGLDELQIPVDHRLDKERIESGERGGFHGRKSPAEKGTYGDNRDGEFPLGIPKRGKSLLEFKGLPLGPGALGTLQDSHGGHDREHDDAGDEPPEEHLLDRDVAGNDGVKDERQAGRKEQAQSSGACDDAQRILLTVFGSQQDRQEESAQGQNGNPEAPVKVVKKAQTRQVMITVPPRMLPTSAVKTRMSRWEAPPSARKYPARVKSGRVGKVGLVTRLY